MVNLDYIKDFEELRKKYKVSCEFEYIDGLDFKVIKETPTIYCYNYRVAIYPITKDICRAHIMTSVNFEKRFEELGIEYIKHEEELTDGAIRQIGQFGESGEFVLDFYLKDIDKLVDVFKIRSANKSHTNPYSIRNLHDYLRFMRSINPWYGEILDKRIIANRDVTKDDENNE